MSLITLRELAANPSTPPVDRVAIFAKANGVLYTINDAGLVIEIGAGSGGGGASPNAITHGFMAHVRQSEQTAVPSHITTNVGYPMLNLSNDATNFSGPSGSFKYYTVFNTPSTVSVNSDGSFHVAQASQALYYRVSLNLALYMPLASSTSGASIHRIRAWVEKSPVSVGGGLYDGSAREFSLFERFNWSAGYNACFGETIAPITLGDYGIFIEVMWADDQQRSIGLEPHASNGSNHKGCGQLTVERLS